MVNLESLKENINNLAPFDNLKDLKNYVYDYLEANGVIDIPSKNSVEFKKLIKYLKDNIDGTLFLDFKNLKVEDIYKDILYYANIGKLMVIGKEILTNKPILDLEQYQEISQYFNTEESSDNWDKLLTLVDKIDLILMDRYTLEYYPEDYELLENPVTYSEYIETI